MTGLELAVIPDILLQKMLDLGKEYALEKLWVALRDYPRRNDLRMAEAIEVDRRDHLVRKLWWLDHTLRNLQCTVANLSERIEAEAEDPQLHRVWDNFVYESIREATFERREMLAAADAGIVDPRLTVQQKARVERIIRQLDPDDVRALYGISRLVAPRNPRYEAWKGLPNRDILVSTGCLRLNVEPLAGAGGVGKPIPELTPLGHNVLRVLNTYLKQKGPSFDVLGRHPEPDAAARATVWEVIGKIKGMNELLACAKRAERPAVYNVQGDSSTLSLFELRESEAAEALKFLEELAIGDGDAFKLDVTTRDGATSVVIHGSHHLLRVVADDVEACWTSPSMHNYK